MKYKLKDIVKFGTNYQDIFNEKLPLQCAYKISKIKNAINEDLEFYQTKSFEIVNEYGKRDQNGNLTYSDDGKTVLMDKDNLKIALEKMKELDEMEIELEIENYLLDLADFDQGTKLSIEDMSSLLPFIK